jgi:hypothetical protein
MEEYEAPRPAKDASVVRPASKRSGDRFAVINAFIDFEMGRLRMAERSVWLTLWRDTRNGVASTSHSSLAKRAGVDPRSARRAIRSLVRLGLVEIVKAGGLNIGANVYRVHPTRRQTGRQLRTQES